MPQHLPELADDDQGSTRSLEKQLKCGTGRETDENQACGLSHVLAEQCICPAPSFADQDLHQPGVPQFPLTE
jgi:hypothetical protein